MVHKIVTVQEPKLRQATRRVEKLDKKVLKIIEDMQETLKVQKDPEGVGLAAPQIGVPLKIFIMAHKGQNTLVINPEIIKKSKKTNDPPTSPRSLKRSGTSEGQAPKKEKEKPQYVMEGCLSLPHYYGPVQRSWEVELKYQVPKLENGNWQLETRHETFTGFPAQIIQHEVDHLKGKTFVDRLLEQNRQLFKLKKGEWHEVDI